MSYRILIMGLPGSGKTTLAEKLQKKLNCPWFNADKVREQYNDWSFDNEGRLRQAKRMRTLADNCPNDAKYVICDFVAPIKEMRDIFEADFLVWMNTLDKSRYEDTDRIFNIPEKCDLVVTSQDAEYWSEFIAGVMMEKEEKIYIVETISTFRHTYYVKARCAEHAMDEVTCQLGNWDEDFIEGSQNHVGEDIASVMEVDEDFFIKTFDAENSYMRNWPRERKLQQINTIDYGD